MPHPTLYSYYQSTASYRVRIALHLKGVDFDTQSAYKLRQAPDPEFIKAYQQLNPQKMVPTLVTTAQQALTQSLSIIEYLEEIYPTPALLPTCPKARAWIRSLAQIIACDIHPMSIMRIRKYLDAQHLANEQQLFDWYHHWVALGMHALEEELSQSDYLGQYCYANQPTLADICLIPQLYNCQRFQCDTSPYPHIMKIYDTCQAHPAFIAAHPDQQPDKAEYEISTGFSMKKY